MLVWIDTETTGLYPRPTTNDDGERRAPSTLLEVACIVTDDDLKECMRYQAVTDEAKRVNFDEVDQVVLDMHAKNGLWGESLAKGKPLHVVDEELATFLSPYVTEEKIQVDANLTKTRKVYPQLAGSTVSFDRGFLEIYLPNVAKQLHYRNLDVTSVNELVRRFSKEVHDARPRTEATAHRAMPDIVESLRVARFYTRVLSAGLTHLDNQEPLDKFCAYVKEYEQDIPRAAPRVENPDHDSLFQRFEQLGLMLDDSAEDYDYRDALREARTLVGLIRGQVLK